MFWLVSLPVISLESDQVDNIIRVLNVPIAPRLLCQVVNGHEFAVRDNGHRLSKVPHNLVPSIDVN